MFQELLISIIVGILLGIITGLIPGIHTNLIASLTLLLQNKLTNFQPILILTTLAVMLIISIFLNFIPSLILGIPDPEKTNIMRPLHRAVLEGKAYLIIKQISIILLITTIISILLLPLLIIIINLTKNLTFLIPVILILVILTNLKKEKRKLLAISIIILAGILGITVFQIEELKEPLLPLLSGLFGISSILATINEKQKLKKQFFPTFTKIKNSEIKKTPIYLFIIALCSFIPAISSSQLVSIIKKDTKTYLITTSIFTLATALISFITVYTLNKARNGVVLTTANFLESLNQINVAIVILTVLISSTIASIILIKLSRIILNNLNKINTKKISIFVIILLISLTILMSGIYGIITLILATILGFITTKLDLNKNYLMSALIIPTIFYFI